MDFVRIVAEAYPSIFSIKRAYIVSEIAYQKAEKLEYLKAYKACWQGIMEQNQCLTLKELAVKGADLIALGIPPGPGLGKILKELLEVVLEDPKKNNKEYLLSQIKDIK